MTTKKFPEIPTNPDFFKIEEEILNYWKENKIFEKSIEDRPADDVFNFYDGPPFKNWIPHYGSLLQSTIKDAIPRYWTMKGKRVPRKWWWDCHGIYIEQKVQQKLWLESNKDIEQFGVEQFVEECIAFTNSVVDERNWNIDHIGRWVDMQNAYETMSGDYMETVMRVFKQIREKWLIYKGKRVSMYSTKLNTPISNFEVQADNSYADISDPAITVKFPIYKDNQDKLYETQEDGFRKYVQVVLKDEKWGVLSLYNVQHGNRQFPWGKVEKGEDLEQALKREVKEEIGVDIEITWFLGWQKIITKNTPCSLLLYEWKIIDGIPAIHEIDKHTSIGYAYLEESNNVYGWGFSINGIIVQNEEEIRGFKDMVLYQNLINTSDIGRESYNYNYNFLAWTTTPWTVPANVALVVHPDIMYAQILDPNTKEHYIIAENLLSKYYKSSSDYILISRSLWSELEWITYHPPFDYYTNKGDQNHKIYLADYVSDTDGTGIVHTSPEFGEDDFQTGKRYNLYETESLDEAWNYTSQIHDMQGIYYRDANEMIMTRLKEEWYLIRKESITHTVPICPRTQVPLIYKTQDSWFINIQSIKTRLFEKNKEINWVPSHIKDGRFLKSMEWAPDWCISRTRFWATPMPVWQSEDGNMHVLGSREEIYQLDQTWSKILEKRDIGNKVIYRDTTRDKEFDLHRPYIDRIWGTIEGKKYTRVVEVLDNRLESWSMPYAQLHYPFENQDLFKDGFPADFIGEGMGQVRARFYVMHVLATILFDKPAYQNVICTGTILGNDGRKMSKSFGNYPDVRPTLMTYGADAIRMFMLNSPLLSGGDLSFSEDGLKEVLRKINLPLRNSYYFFTTYANIDNFTPTKFSLIDFIDYQFENDLDERLISKLAQLILHVDKSFAEYDIPGATKPLYKFMDDLTNWYIRRNRRRFWRSENDTDKMVGYDVLYVVLCELSKILAPFMPFLSEYIYRNLTWKQSVHLESWTQ